jgi:hypothetical protein
MRAMLFIAVAVAASCTEAAPPPPKAPGPPAAAASGGIQGTVTEKIDAAQYSYLKLRTAQGELWAAVPKTETAVGAQVSIVNAVWMQNFKSSTLNRTWDRIAFGTLEDGAAPAAARERITAGHPRIDPPQGMSPQAEARPIKVAKASGARGRTVAEIWSKRDSLKGQEISVRGKVVKATNGVMGRNWLHVRDGTGEGPTSDLTVATGDTAAVGATVLVTGTVTTDKDLGGGYHYDVLVENARLKAE